MRFSILSWVQLVKEPNLIVLILVVILYQNGIAKGNDFEKVLQSDTLTYAINGFNSKVTLMLLPNNQFVRENFSFDCVSIVRKTQILGEYDREKNEILLQPREVKLIVENIKSKSKSDTTILYEQADMKIRTKYYQVKVNETHCLLSNENKETIMGATLNDFEELVEDIENGKYGWKPYFIAENIPEQTFYISDLPQKYQNILKDVQIKTYHVQLGVFKHPNNFDTSVVKGLGEIDFYKTETGLTMVLIGQYRTYAKAKLLEQKIKEQGQEAMVVAIEDGKKVPL